MVRILIAEDNTHVRWTLVTLLQSWGLDVDQVANGQQALQRFADRPADLVVLDAHMPGMDGLEACQQIRRQSGVPIAMMSTLGHTALRDQALACGANAFLTKPLEIDNLLAWVRSLCKDKDEFAPAGELDTPNTPGRAKSPRQEPPSPSPRTTAGPLLRDWRLRAAPSS